jgi:hypothetical protein
VILFARAENFFFMSNLVVLPGLDRRFGHPIQRKGKCRKGKITNPLFSSPTFSFPLAETTIKACSSRFAQAPPCVTLIV